MNKFSIVGAGMLVSGVLVGFVLRDGGHSILPAWLVPGGALLVMVGAITTVEARGHREMVVLVALAVLLSASVDDRAVKAVVLSVAGLGVMLLNRRQPHQSPLVRPVLPAWTLWGMSIGAVLLVLWLH